MLYEISCTLRFKDPVKRDGLKKYLLGQAKLAESIPASFVSTHLCFHDEKDFKPCQVEEHFDITSILLQSPPKDTQGGSL